VVITLLGRFKNEIGESYHMMPVMTSTSRGLHPRIWVSRVLEEYQRIGIQRGYTYRNLDGTKLKVKVMEPKFMFVDSA
jgi:hypothetical protein